MIEDQPYGWVGNEILFDANYGRVGRICATDTVCSGCQKAAVCIHMDQSEREYNAGAVCRDCIATLFGVPK